MMLLLLPLAAANAAALPIAAIAAAPLKHHYSGHVHHLVYGYTVTRNGLYLSASFAPSRGISLLLAREGGISPE